MRACARRCCISIPKATFGRRAFVSGDRHERRRHRHAGRGAGLYRERSVTCAVSTSDQTGHATAWQSAWLRRVHACAAGRALRVGGARHRAGQPVSFAYRRDAGAACRSALDKAFAFLVLLVVLTQHDFLWRTTRDLPERGRIGNRSYYEEVLIARVRSVRPVTDMAWARRAGWRASALTQT